MRVPTYEPGQVGGDATIKATAQALPTEDFGTGALGGLDSAAGALDKLGELQDEASAKQIDLQYAAFQRETLYGQQGLFGKQGVNALNALPDVKQQLADKRDELLTQATTTRQRMMLTDTLNSRMGSALDSVSRYGQEQTIDYYRTSSAASVQNNIDQYVAEFPTDPAKASSALSAARMEQSRLNSFNGGDADTEEQALLGVTTKAHAAVISNMMARGDPVAADHYFQVVQGEMDPVTRASVGEQVSKASDAFSAQAAAGAVMASGAAASAPIAGGVADGAGQPVLPKGGLADAIRSSVGSLGGDAKAQNDLVLIGMLEGGLNPHPKNNGSSTGAFQFHPETFNRILPGGDINNPADQIKAAYLLYKQDHDALASGLGREPSTMELYLAHQQGIGGAKALLTAPPNVNAIEAVAPVYGGNMTLARKAIVNNGGTPTSTAGQFLQIWQGKVLRKTGAAATVAGPALNPTSGGMVATPDRETYVNSVIALAGPDQGRQMAFRAAAEGRWTQMHEAQTDADERAQQAVQPLLRDPTITTYDQFVQKAGPAMIGQLKQTTLTQVYDHFKSGGVPIQSDRSTVSALHDLYTSDPTAFKKLDLTQYTSKLGNEDWQWALSHQDGLRAGKPPDQAHQVTWDRINSASSDLFDDLQMPHGVNFNGKKVSAQQNAAYAQSLSNFKVDMLARATMFQQQNNRPPSDQEIHNMAAELTRMRVHARLAATKPGERFKWSKNLDQTTPIVSVGDQAAYVPLESIPPAAVARIRSDYQAKHGSAPTQEYIEDFYPVAHALGRL